MTRNWQSLFNEVTGAFSPFYQGALDALRVNGMLGPQWNHCFMALGLDPEPLTVEQFYATNPLTNIEARRQGLDASVEGGFLRKVGPDAYRLTERGRAGITAFFNGAAEELGNIQPLPGADLARLADLLQTAITTITEDGPERKPQFSFSRATDPGQGAALTARIDQYVTDLVRWREDAHFAVVVTYDLPMPSWEALTYLWQGDFDGLKQGLAGRGYDDAAYDAALQNLVTRELAVKDGAAYTLTDAGKALRQEAEDRTNMLYGRMLGRLSASEVDELEALLNRLRDALRTLGSRQVWDTIQNRSITAAMAPFYQTRTAAIFQEQNFQNGYWFLIMEGKAAEHLTGATSVDKVRRRYPYNNPEHHAAQFSQMADDGLMAPADGEYTLTAKAHAAERAVNTTFYSTLAALPDRLTEAGLYTTADLQAIRDLLTRLAEAVLTAPEPPAKWSLHGTEAHHPGESGGLLGQIDIALDLLTAYREDVHMHVFQAHGFEGLDIDIYTRVWRGEFDKPADYPLTNFRGWDEATIASTFDALVTRGLLRKSGDSYAVTEQGATLRQQLEDETDALFFAPWNSALTLAEVGQLRTQFEALIAALRALRADELLETRGDLYQVVQDAAGAVAAVAGGPAFQESFVQNGIGNGTHWFWLLTAAAIDPAPLTVDHVQARVPYLNPVRSAELLAEVAETGLLQPQDGGYTVNARGREALQAVLDGFYGRLNAANPLSDEDAAALAELLDRVVAAAQNAPVPSGGTLVADWMGLYPGEDAAPLHRIDTCFDALNAWRDGAHIAAFGVNHVSGHGWEYFNLLGQGQVTTPQSMVEARPGRGYKPADYGAEAEILAGRGWLAAEGEGYALTETGRQVHQDTEQRTDRYFVMAFRTISDEDAAQLRTLLNQLCEGLRQQVEAQPA